MRTTFLRRLCFGLALPLALLALAPVRGDDRGSVSATIRAVMQPFVDAGDISGAVTVVGRKDAIVSYEAIGLQNLETRTPMARDTLFRIASMTKPITAIGIMILADEGRLKAEDPVEKYLPEFRGQMLVAERKPDMITLKKPARPITLRDLLTHTSGLQTDFRPGLTDLYIKRNHTLAEGVMAFSQRPLDFEPGSKWAYCNPGIDTLGRIIEVVSHQFYEDFLRTRIFQPLGMTATTFYPTDGQLERAAVTYGKQNGKLVPTPNTIIGSPVGARYAVPAGGLYSTGSDLAKLYQMMLNRGTLGSTRILSPEGVATMTKVQTGDLECGFVPGMSFGYGWAVVREPKDVTYMLSPGSYGHGGAFGTQAWLDPTRDLFVVLLIQRTGLPNSDASSMRKALQEAAVSIIKK
jgi:CubicO group peptidase (beta-lactamase class C family)